MNSELVAQTKYAFDFIRKLYFEVSYLIKEVEGLVQQEKEAFIIGRPSGYSVTTRTSSGLEALNIEQWFPRNFTVFFCPEAGTKVNRGKTTTPFSSSLRLLLLHIELFDIDLDEPRVLGGYISNIKTKKPKQYSKFEQLMFEFAYNTQKIFTPLPRVSFEDTYCSFEGNFLTRPLFSISNSEDVTAKLVDPMLELYRHQPVSA